MINSPADENRHGVWVIGFEALGVFLRDGISRMAKKYTTASRKTWHKYGEKCTLILLRLNCLFPFSFVWIADAISQFPPYGTYTYPDLIRIGLTKCNVLKRWNIFT